MEKMEIRKRISDSLIKIGETIEHTRQYMQMRKDVVKKWTSDDMIE